MFLNLKYMRLIFTILLLFLLTGCGGTPQKKSEPKQVQIPVVNLSTTYPDKDYGDIAELECIPLETKNNVLVAGYNRLDYVSDERIIITNPRIGDVLVFDGKGKSLFRFNHKGGGPAEYSSISKTVYDAKNREIFIFTYNKSAIVYSEQGEYKRNWNYGGIEAFHDVFSFDDESFLAHIDSETTDSSYVFISKNSGEILSTVNLPVANVIATSIKENKQMASVSAQQLFRDGDGFILSPISLDTVYRLNKNKQFVPLFTKISPVVNSDILSAFMPLLVTDRFIVFVQFTVKLDINNPNPSIENKTFTYDREENQFYGNVKWDEDKGIGLMVSHTDLQKNWWAFLLDIHYIKDWIEKGRAHDKLKALAPTLKDEDNPVLIVTKFK
jgi:hypothetical protein